MAELSSEELLRYSRHLTLPEVTLAGQQRLKDARVLCVGAGGLGSPLALYLSAAGIGRLGLVDFDTVDLSNIQRQVLYSTADVGRPKLEAAAERLGQLNPHVEVIPHAGRLSADNVMDIAAGYDVLVDGSDNFATRYLVNDAAVLSGKPVVHASVFRFEGQLSVFDASRGPCYRCVFPEPPPAELVPSCAEGGVMGMLPGVLGTMQALEVVKLILGQGETLAGRLLLFDGLGGRWRELAVDRDPDCPLCGHSPTIHAPKEMATVCADTVGGRTAPRLTVETLAARMAAGDAPALIDVREPHEWQIARIDSALCIPLGELPERLGELDPKQPYVITCHKGPRSEKAADILRREGFTQVEILEGGVDAWAERVDTTQPRY